jgi:uncharacterized protein (DUF433 family)
LASKLMEQTAKNTANFRLIGAGIYSVPEAARLTQIPTARIRRWVKGYTYRSGPDQRVSTPVVHSQLEPIDGVVALGFLDLIEVRFVDAFRSHGVGWKAIRIAYDRARDLIGSKHPFSTRRFRTDGRRIFADIIRDAGEPILLELVSNEFAFRKVLSPYLYAGLEFSEDEVARWWPMGESGDVVIDPERSFGQPIVHKEGVPTRVLAQAFRVEESYDAVARWYDVNRRSVRQAVEFEKRLAA